VWNPCLSACRIMQDRRRRGVKQLEHETDGLVLLQSQGQEVSHWEQSQPCDGCRILEGNWARQTHSRGKAAAVDRPAQDARVLQRPRTSRREDRLDHARVSPGRQPCRHDHNLCNARRPPRKRYCLVYFLVWFCSRRICRGYMSWIGLLLEWSSLQEDGSWVVCRVFRKTKNCKPKSDVDARAGSMEPDQQAGAAVLLLPHQQGGVNSPAAEIQLSMSDGGGGQGAAAAGVMCYLPAAYSHQNQQIQYLCNQEIINQQQQLADNYSRYHDEMGHEDPAAAAAAFPHLQQLAEIPKFEAAHHGYSMNSCNPSASSSSSFRSGQHELLQRQGKKAVDCSSTSNSYMPQFGASTGGELVRTADVGSIDWMFEGAHGGAAAAAARDQAHLMNMRSIPSTSTGTCGTRRDHSLGDVTIHLQVMSRQLSSHVDQHFSSSNGLHHEVDDFWNFTDQKWWSSTDGYYIDGPTPLAS